MDVSVKKIRICLGSSCYTRGNADNLDIIKAFIDEHQIDCQIDFRGHLCCEKCNRGPVIEIDQTVYEGVSPSSVRKILQENLMTAKL